VIVLAIVLLLLPGFTWWAWLCRRDRDLLVSFAMMIGISLAFWALLSELIFLLGGSLVLADTVGIMTILLVLTIAGLVKNGLKIEKRKIIHLLIGFAFFGLVIAWRLYQAKDLLLPNWVDSQHHYLIIKVILESGGLPGSLSPYLDVPFFYHYGFHAVTALFTRLSGLEIGEAMLVLGQVLNAAIGLSVYVLGKALWEDWRPAALAGLLVSFITRMPAYYLSWGRYTLVTGLILLPLAMAVSILILKKSHSKKTVLTLAVLTAGVILSHYFAAVLLAIFLVILVLVYIVPRWKTPLSALSGSSGVFGGALGGLLLAAPWLVRVARFSTASTGIGSNLPASYDTILASSQWDYIWKLLGPANNRWLLVPAGIGLVWALTRKKEIHFGIWALILGLLSLPWSFTIRPFRPDHFAIILFLPAALLASWCFWQISLFLEKRHRKRWVSLTFLGLILAGWTVWGFLLNSDNLNAKTVLVTEDDLEALDWVIENTPEDARFFINTAYWLNNTYRGVDGGGWLLPYSERWSLVPTVFYGYSPDKDEVNKIRQWGERASQITTCSEEFWALVRLADLDWIYIREGVGELQPESLENCEDITNSYTNGSVNVYKIEP
jgi:hypothetical protein